MKTASALIAFLFIALVASAAPVVPGTVHMLKDGDKEVKAKAGDIVVARIPNPALAKMVSDLDITVTGGAKLAGAVNASDVRDGRSVPGSGHIRIYVTVEKAGALEYSYKDGAGETHKKKIMIHLEK